MPSDISDNEDYGRLKIIMEMKVIIFKTRGNLLSWIYFYIIYVLHKKSI